MRYKKWPREGIGPGNLDLIKPIFPEEQSIVRIRYIWNIPPAEWPKGITAGEVAEMKRRHDKLLRERWKKQKEGGQ